MQWSVLNGRKLRNSAFMVGFAFLRYFIMKDCWWITLSSPCCTAPGTPEEHWSPDVSDSPQADVGGVLATETALHSAGVIDGAVRPRTWRGKKKKTNQKQTGKPWFIQEHLLGKAYFLSLQAAIYEIIAYYVIDWCNKAQVRAYEELLTGLTAHWDAYGVTHKQVKCTFFWEAVFVEDNECL